MEAYIGKCLDSLLIPEFDAVEVLVVNDGSRDRSSEIAHTYADRYPTSIRVIDKPNGNYGSCINAALPLATGRYVKVLDADDTFDTTAFSRFVRLISTVNADLLITDMVMVDECQHLINTSYRSHGKLIDGQIYSFSQISSQIESLSMHSIAYKTDNFNRIQYKQTEGVSYTDNEWIFLPMSVCDTVIYFNIGDMYHYLVGRSGQTMDPNVYLTKSSDIFTVNLNILKVYESAKGSNKILNIQYLRNRTKAHLYRSYCRSIKLKSSKYSEELRHFDDTIKNISPEIYKALEEIPLNNHTSYFLVKELRNKQFDCTHQISAYVRIKSILSKLLGIKW